MSKKPPDKLRPNYRSIKQTLKNVVRTPEIQEILLKTVMMTHRITIHTYLVSIIF